MKRLQLGNVYTCNGLEKANSRAFFHTLIERFVNRRFGNPWQLPINKIHETPMITLCNFKQASLSATKI
jgi:hypothetical protein